MNGAPLILVGAGGHALVLLDALAQLRKVVLGLVDRDPSLRGRRILGIEVLGDEDTLRTHSPESVLLVNAIGSIASLSRRQSAFERLSHAGYSFAGVIHPSAIVSPYSAVVASAQVMAGAVVQAGAEIGENTIVNTGATVDHDCAIGAHVHLAPGATLSGNVTVGDRTHVGAGATIIQGVRVGAGCTVAAGAVVVRPVPDGMQVAGVPAREAHR